MLDKASVSTEHTEETIGKSRDAFLILMPLAQNTQIQKYTAFRRLCCLAANQGVGGVTVCKREGDAELFCQEEKGKMNKSRFRKVYNSKQEKHTGLQFWVLARLHNFVIVSYLKGAPISLQEINNDQ